MATTIQTIELPKKARALDTSGNNNHGQIYSGRGLEFDGVTDYLTTGGSDLTLVDFSAETTQANRAWTVACWVNIDSASIGHIQNVIGTGSGISTSYLGIDTNEKLTIYDQTGGAYRTSDTALNANTWYRALWVFNGVDEIAFYLNGVADGTSAMGTTGDDADLALRYIGARAAGNETASASRYFTGKMSDLQLWQGAFTAADVTYDYLNPESLALNAGGTALTNSNLKLWYPMQDGHRGQQSYILDGANTGLKDNIYSTLDFTDGWTGSDTSSISASAFTSTGNGGVYTSDSSTNQVVGTTYKVTLDLTTDADGFWLRNAGDSVIYLDNNSTGAYSDTIYFTATHAQFYIRNRGAGTTTINSLSIEPINDKNHATTVFHGDEQISATNDKTFAGASNWANAAGANAFNAYDETTSGQLTVTPDDVGDVQYAFLDGAHWEDDDGDGPDMVAGRTYRLSYDIHVSAFTKGTLSVGLSTDAVPAVMTFKNDYTATNGTGASATLDFVYTAATCEMITIYAAANTVLTADFDNFSLKEVGIATGWTDADQQLHIPQPALQSYNELAWFDGTTVSDGYIDLDSEIDTSTNDWSLSFWTFRQDNGQTFDITFGPASRDDQFIALDVSNLMKYRDSSNTYHTISDAAIPENEWVHIVVTAVGNASITAYVNGVAQATNSAMSNPQLLLKKFMRGFNSASYQTLGTINEISYYNDVLTSAEVLDLFNDGKAKSALEADGSAGLVGYWRNNGLSEWKDLKGSNDGNKTAGVTETILIPAGVDSTRDNQGFIMNKQKDTSCLNLTNGFDIPYVDLGSETTVAADDTASFVVWLKPDDTGSSGGNYFLGKGASQDSIKIHSSTVIRFRANNVDDDFTVGTITPGEWIHVAVVKAGGDTDEMSVYIDGVLNGTAGTDTETSNEPFDYRYIGAMRPTSNTFRGQIDGFLVYSDALTQAEVERNYNATKGSHRN